MAKTDPNAARDYFVADKEIRFVGATRVPRGSKTVKCSPADAAFFLAGGGLSEKDPAEVQEEAKDSPKPAEEPKAHAKAAR